MVAPKLPPPLQDKSTTIFSTEPSAVMISKLALNSAGVLVSKPLNIDKRQSFHHPAMLYGFLFLSHDASNAKYDL